MRGSVCLIKHCDYIAGWEFNPSEDAVRDYIVGFQRHTFRSNRSIQLRLIFFDNVRLSSGIPIIHTRLPSLEDEELVLCLDKVLPSMQ